MMRVVVERRSIAGDDDWKATIYEDGTKKAETTSDNPNQAISNAFHYIVTHHPNVKADEVKIEVKE